MFIALGLLAGLIGFVPIFISLRVTRRMSSGAIMSLAMCGLGGIFASLVLLVVMLILCAKLAHDALIGFAIAEVAVFLVCTIVYVLVKTRTFKKKEASDEEK